MLSLQDPLNLVAPPLVALVTVLATLLGYAPFERWFERRVLNIPIQPDQLLEKYSERILTSLDESTLRNLFVNELLPSWLIRQFALLQWDGVRLHPFISLGVAPAQLPQTLNAPVDWARATLPLTLNSKTVGLMLFGRRDPDDFYAVNEVSVLQQVANLTALGLANIKQSAALLELYQTDIERQETERTALAAELHDDVLQHMALMSNQFADLQPTPELLETYQYTANRIREITSGLRAPLLAFGLTSALEGLVENIQDRGLKNTTLVCELTGDDVRLDERLELHLFRLAQQALDNALQHAQAGNITLSGDIGPTAVHLQVSDNGVGFAAGEQLNVSGLLANKHFGVVGMFERAAWIGAEMSIRSQPGQGCQVTVHWAAK
jgi:signal transduction histidine kinase